MSVVATIKQDLLQARKSREQAKIDLLTTLYGEAQTVSKNNNREQPTDGEVIGLIKKFIKNNEEVIALSSTNQPVCDKCKHEIGILTGYLPKQLSTEELTTVINQVIHTFPANTPKTIGNILKVLKQQFEGHYDNKLAASLTKQILGN